MRSKNKVNQKMIKHIISFTLILLTIAACAPTGIIAIPSSIADRRTTGVQVEDQTIEFKALYEFQKMNGDFSVSATSYNQNVLITGESTSQELKDQIQDVVAKIEGVKSIYNEVLVTSSLPLKEKAKSKTKDYGITTNIKARLFKEETKSNVSPVHIKVVTERQIVYLMGLVTRQEADEALQIAKTSSGVLKVKSFFEINSQYKKN
jgi:osmotically-inducible protein OsmY